MRILPMGPSSVLVEAPDPDPMAWSLAFRKVAPPGVVDVVPAAATVLVRCESTHALKASVRAFEQVADIDVTSETADRVVTIPVAYDGPDLGTVAGAADVSAAEVVRLHSEAEYEVAFCGFAPGFAYLRGLPAPLHLPRRATPRTRVPVGSVAIAAEYSAVYPGASPGGWHLIGATDLTMFDPSADSPALLQPGTTVRFRPA